MDEDFFDAINKRFKKMFKDWSFFDEDKDFFKDFNETFEFKAPKSSGESKNYSISYKYKTGMKEPEIRIEGDATNEEINHFLEGVQKRFGKHILGISDKRSGYAIPERAVRNDPSIDLIEEEDKNIYTLEMPGIGKNDIKYNIKEYSVIISAKNNGIEYNKTIYTKFKPKKVDITANNGIITFTLWKK
jgi:hypothetical protein